MSDYQVQRAWAVAAAILAVITTQAGVAVEPVDPGDGLGSATWVLTLGSGAPAGALLPLVRRVDVAQSAGPTSAVRWLLYLDAPLTPGAPYELGLAANAQAAGGHPTSTNPVQLTGPAVRGVAAQRPGTPGGDLALPPVAGPGGDLAVVSRLDALRARVLLAVRARRGAFAHEPDLGRGVEPKRTYSPAKLAAEASAIKAQLLRDPDVSQASVSARKDGHVTFFDLSVTPVFDTEPLVMKGITAGGEET